MTFDEAIAMRKKYEYLIMQKPKGQEISVMLIADAAGNEVAELIDLYQRLGISEVSRYAHQDYDIVILLDFDRYLLTGILQKTTLTNLLQQLK